MKTSIQKKHRKVRLQDFGLELSPTLTAFTRRIGTHCEIARQERVPAEIRYGAGLGVSTALRQWVAASTLKEGGPIMVSIPSAPCRETLLAAIASAAGIHGGDHSAVASAVAAAGALIVDEVKDLRLARSDDHFFGCMDLLHDLHRETACGMILAVGGRFKAETLAERRYAWERLFSGSYFATDLGHVIPRDHMEPILGSYGLKWPAPDLQYTFTGLPLPERPLEIIDDLCRRQHIAAIVARIRHGQRLAAAAREKFSWKHFCGAHLTIAAMAISGDPTKPSK